MPWPARLTRHPSAFLLAAQLLALVLFPVMDNTGTAGCCMRRSRAVVVALALWVVNRSPVVNWVAWVFAAPAIALSLRHRLLRDPACWPTPRCSNRRCTSMRPAA
jgi:hypothetical protein